MGVRAMSGYWSHLECCWVQPARSAGSAGEALPQEAAATAPAELPAQRAVRESQDLPAPASG